MIRTPNLVQDLCLKELGLRSNPVVLIRFSQADPSGGRGQDKTRSGENCASALRIVGPHQIYR